MIPASLHVWDGVGYYSCGAMVQAISSQLLHNFVVEILDPLPRAPEAL